MSQERKPLYSQTIETAPQLRPDPLTPAMAGGIQQGANQLFSGMFSGGGSAPVLPPSGSMNFPSVLAAQEAGLVPNESLMSGGVGASAPVLPTSPFSLSGIGSAGNALLPIAGAFGAWDSLSNDREGIRGYGQAALSGAAMGSYFGAPGAIVGGVGGLLAKGAQDLFGSGKSGAQKSRDRARDELKRMGVVSGELGKEAILETWGGDTLDIGIDGSGKGNYNVDFTNPLAGQAVGLMNPLAAIISEKTGTPREQVAGWLTNGILQNNSDPNNLVKEAQFLYRKMGIGPQQLLDGLGQLAASGKISQGELEAFANAIKGITQNNQNLRMPG